MGMHVSDFARMAGGGDGSFRVDAGTGQLQVADKGLFGKIVAWFRAKSDPGKVQGENMSAMNTFIRAIGTDPKYGPEFANMATQTLTPLLQQGKPLTARVVSQLVGDMNRQLAQVKSLNTMTAMRLSENDTHGDPNCFGAIFTGECVKRGLNIPLADLDVSRLQESIATRINEAGKNGKHVVTLEEAKNIAQEECAKFVNVRIALFEHIDGLDASMAEKATLKEMVCKSGYIRKPEYLDQLLSLKRAGHDLLTALSSPDCSRADAMRAMTKYNEAYGQAFGRLRDEASGADDVVRFGGDSLDFALKTAGTSQEDKQRMFNLLTSQGCKELRQAMCYIGMVQSDLPGVTEESAQVTASIMGRSQEFVSELATTLGMSLGMTREQTFKALEDPSIVIDSWAKVPKDVGDVARTLGATVPSGVKDIHKKMVSELAGHKGDPVQILRTDGDASKLIGAFMRNHGKACTDHAQRCLDQAKAEGGDAQAVHQRFMTLFLGGTTPREVFAFVNSHPEIFGPVRDLARDLHEQGLVEGGPEHAFFAVQNAIFLRGIVPALVMHNFNPADMQANALERQVGALFQQGIGNLHGDAPNPLLRAFFDALTKDEISPERLQTQFNQQTEKLLAHKANALEDESGPMLAPHAFAKEIGAFNATLREMHAYCDNLGLDFNTVFPNADARLGDVMTHLAEVVKPSNLALGELNRRQVGAFESALKSLGVDYPQTPFRTEMETRLAPMRTTYQQAIGNLATAIRGQNPAEILRYLKEVGETGNQLLQAANEMGARIDDPDKLKTFRLNAYRTALASMSEEDTLALMGALNHPGARILQDGLMDAAYKVMRQNEDLAKELLTMCVGMGEFRDAVSSFLEGKGVQLPPLPDQKEYGLADFDGPQRAALRSVFGVSHEDGKARIASGAVNERFLGDFTAKLNTPLTTGERAMKTIGRGEQTGVTEQFWKDLERSDEWHISDGVGSHKLYTGEGWGDLDQEGRAIRLMDGIRQLKEVCGNDPEMLQFVTQYAHQGLMACILSGCMSQEGSPIRLPDGRAGVPIRAEESISYTFSRNEAGDVAVHVTYKGDPLVNLMTPDGRMIPLDPAASKCRFDFDVTFTRDKQVVVSSPITFDYDIREQR